MKHDVLTLHEAARAVVKMVMITLESRSKVTKTILEHLGLRIVHPRRPATEGNPGTIRMVKSSLLAG